MLKTFSITDIGKKRKQNQDYVFTRENKVGPFQNLFIVADGMGGHKAGEYASKLAVEEIYNNILLEETCENELDIVFILRKAIEKANSIMHQKGLAEENLQGMGTTVVVATIYNNKLITANVGDSRLYLIDSEKEMKQITKDHSLVEEMVRMGGLAPELARVHPDKNIITRAIGVREDVVVDFFEVPIQKGNIVLMCSDGLTNMLEDDEIQMIIRGQRDIVEQAEELVKAANENGGKDNIAIVLIEPFAEVE